MTITLLPSQRQIAANPPQSILDTVRQAGVNLPHSCKSGRCGSCKARLVSGQVRDLISDPAGISEEEKKQGDILLCQSTPLTDVRIEVREAKPADSIEERRLPVRVAKLIPWSEDLLGVILQLPAVEPFSFRAGQYLDLILPHGERRSYSIASPPHDAKTLELHIRKVKGGTFTESLFERLKPGALLEIEGPKGEFGVSLTVTQDPLIFVAGGTGYAPIKSLLRSILETQPTGPVHLYWGVRTRLDCYDWEWLRATQARFENFKVTIAVSNEKVDDAQFKSGLVHAVLLSEQSHLSNATMVAAGPPVMLETLIHELPTNGFDLKRLTLDSQGARLSASAQALMDAAN